MQKYLPRFIASIVTSLTLLIACSPNVLTPQSSPGTLQPPIATFTETSTETQTPTVTLSPTFTPSPTATETPTITPSPTPNMVMPGNFSVGGCGSVSMSQGGTLDFCMTSVTVDSNRHMIFNVTWTLSKIPSGFTVTKRSDKGNKKMYLIDNLGNRYDHIAGGGAAYASVVVTDGAPISGWFDFGTPPVEAFTFAFHDDDNKILIGGISLFGGAASPIISYKELKLDQYPLLLQYQEDLWQLSVFTDNSLILVGKTISFCTVRAIPSRQPKGEYKNTIELGTITYEIYGYFDDSIGLFVREYSYKNGLSGADSSLKPLFLVTIPSDNSLNCILYVSNVLSSLAPRGP